jgi:hypothetical protein
MTVRLRRKGGGARRANTPPIFFEHKNSFLATELTRRQIKHIEILSKQVFGKCKDRKNKKIAFYGTQKRLS